VNDRLVALVAVGLAAAFATSAVGVLIFVAALAVLPRMVAGDLRRLVKPHRDPRFEAA